MARLGMDRSQIGLEEKNSDTLDMLQRIDLETTLAEGLLTKADRAGMASALELRTPFLDQFVMEFAATLPVDQRVRGFTTKHFLKNYALRYLPAQIVHRRKRGLSVPLAQWLRGPLFDWAQDRLASNLGGLEHARGRYVRGEIFSRRAFAIREKALGSEYPAVAADFAALATILDAQGKRDEAERLYRYALARFRTPSRPGELPPSRLT